MQERIIKSPVTRIFLGLFVCLTTIIIVQQIFLKIPGIGLLSNDFRNLIKGIVVSFLAMGSYAGFYYKYEKRVITELSIKGIGKILFLGLIIGVGLQCLTILVIYLFGSFKIISINAFSTLIIPFTVAITVAIIEEILLRGIVFRITEERLGSVIALIISGIIFGGLHLINPHVTLVSTLCTTTVGIFLGAAYMCYRSLWFPITIHFAWNFTQNGIFGAITSGNEKTNSLLATKIGGHEIISGGQFGPEGAIQTLFFFLTATAIIIQILNKNRKFVAPYWKNRHTPLNSSKYCELK
ncbi:CPBP family intramembrane metalloprotease domain-containing protein [Flavipsychrobacter stenotrophus]|uniref:CPBP family intramembrane metalloprotease domain-containing protein n=1 Tax=Flavipsychrobacter stenotrophus TaxID=2077091 RepID=A0A2S7SQF8_9BACT|nr:type II CAAX endopeptidase family protein [Flavipsychrobacter stenotrophus]PQJ09139.1 CPBP family intramembrane metalloprotease domain-containing protein [Flavipsychrobacter stenotrophus]